MTFDFLSDRWRAILSCILYLSIAVAEMWLLDQHAMACLIAAIGFPAIVMYWWDEEWE